MQRRIVQRVAEGELAPARAAELLEGAPWEETLERLEAEHEAGRQLAGGLLRDDVHLVIAQQLRELILAVRPLLKHPLLRRY